MCRRGFEALDYGPVGRVAVYSGLYAVSEQPYVEGGSSSFIWNRYLNRHLESSRVDYRYL